jgi:hypothetical protein
MLKGRFITTFTSLVAGGHSRIVIHPCYLPERCKMHRRQISSNPRRQAEVKGVVNEIQGATDAKDRT